MTDQSKHTTGQKPAPRDKPTDSTKPTYGTKPNSKVKEDPILVQRAIVADRVSKALRVGTAFYVFASGVFFVGYMTGFTPTSKAMVTALLIAGSILLAPALVFNYGVKAADRADRNEDW